MPRPSIRSGAGGAARRWSRSCWARAWAPSPSGSPTRSTIDYADLPGFPRPSVQGHAGQLVLGQLGGVPVACLPGRAHLYEGVGAAAAQHARAHAEGRRLPGPRCSPTPRARCGPNSAAGSLVLIEDHINLQGTNPLVGPNDDADRPALRRPDRGLRQAPARRDRGRRRGRAGSLSAGGVYLAVLGPGLRDAGRDPCLPHAGRRPGRHVDRARGDQRPACRAGGGGASRS